MNRIFLLFALSLLGILPCFCQNLDSKAALYQLALGPVSHREIWVSCVLPENITEATAHLTDDSTGKVAIYRSAAATMPDQTKGHTFKLTSLTPGHTYRGVIKWGGKEELAFGPFKTQAIWEYRTPAPDFSFLLGSCFYVNDTPFDRPGKAYGGDTRILDVMAKDTADFQIWGGDNLYFREADFSSPSGLIDRYQHSFGNAGMATLRATRPSIAIWDDHDYGSNDSDRNFVLAPTATELFKTFWPSPYYKAGCGSVYSYNDCDFFLMDDRSFRAPNKLADSIGNAPNTNKPYLGSVQMQWLTDGLLNSNAPFKFVVIGNQVVNNHNKYECYAHFDHERQQLYQFIADNKINGVIFLSGDRHHTDLLSYESPVAGSYPLYDFTCSAVLSGTHKIKSGDPEFALKEREDGALFLDNNYARLTIKGAKGKRLLLIDVKDATGKKVFEWSVSETLLRWGN
jgi:alkaline phosphatase D